MKKLSKMTAGLLAAALMASGIVTFAAPAAVRIEELSEITVPASPVEAVKMLREMEKQKQSEQKSAEEAPEHDVP